MAKYTPQKIHGKIGEKINDITFNFDEIAQIINDKLPPSSLKYSAWWANERNGVHVSAKAWLAAGWKVDRVDITRK